MCRRQPGRPSGHRGRRRRRGRQDPRARRGSTNKRPDRPVASISAADPRSALISDAIDKVGKDGVITVERSDLRHGTRASSRGMRFDKGYISPYMVTDPSAWRRSSTTRTSCSSSKINVRDPVPVLEKVMQPGAALIVAGTSRARPWPPWSSARSAHVRSVAVKAPASASAARRCCRTWPSSPAARSFRGGRPQARARPGPARHGPTVVVTKDETTIVVKGRCRRTSRAASPRSRPRSTTPTPTTTAKLQERLAKLSGGVAVPQGRRRHRGGAQGEEAPHRGRRVDHQRPPSRRVSSPAVAWPCVPRQAVDGLVEAGGRRGHRCHPDLPAARGPLKQIAENAGLEGGVVVERVRGSAASEGSTPPPASTRTWSAAGPRRRQGHPLGSAERGVVAALFLTTEAVVADEKAAGGAPTWAGWTSDPDLTGFAWKFS